MGIGAFRFEGRHGRALARSGESLEGVHPGRHRRRTLDKGVRRILARLGTGAEPRAAAA
jgi:hypothetical protein